MPGLIILPVELRHRELTSRLATAAHLVNAGATVVIGQQWAIFNNVDFWPKGVILFKTLNAIQAENMERFAAAGHKVAAMDEEVLTYRSNFTRTIAQNAFADLFLAQSEPHAREVRGRSLFNTIAITGNPRAEQYSQFAAEAAKIRTEYGPFILFNTNYPTINSMWGSPEAAFEIAQRGGCYDVDQHEAWVKWETANRDHLKLVMAWVMPYRKFIIRPHPGEKPDYWDSPSAHVVRNSHPLPWILAAELVVHTGCTTGLEAALAGIPVLNIETSPSPVAARITSLVNHTVTNWIDAASAISQFLETRSGPIAAHPTEALEKYFPNHSAGRAASNIAAELLKCAGSAPVDWFSATGAYKCFARDESSRTKFSASRDEVAALFHAAQKHQGVVTKATVVEIDEGVFVIERS